MQFNLISTKGTRQFSGFMLEPVATKTGTTRRFTPALEKAIQSGRVEIDRRKATRKTTGIFWRKARPNLFQ